LRKDNTVPIGTLANLPSVIDELGYDGWGFMQAYGLEPNAFVRPLQPVPITLCGELLHAAVGYTHCDTVPLLLGAKARMENLGPLRLLVASSARVREAVNALIRFRKVWFSGFQILVNEEHGVASMAIDFSGNFVGHQLLRTSYLKAMERHLDIIVGRPWKVRQVHLSRPKPADTAPYRRHFGVTPSFGQVHDALFFDARLLDLKRHTTHDGDLHAYFRRQLTTMEAELGSSFAEQVAELIESLLMGGRCNVELVAQVFGIHRLTLYRRLREYETTFESLLEERRRAMAEAMLQRRTVSIAEIAESLGYGTPANFSRAFRRWTGKPPTAWRHDAGS
jgi:AraC-like DNA-binding protein